MFAPQAGYDRALTIFSPDGRLYQVEYAIETVRHGTLAMGIRYKDGVVLCAEEKLRKLQAGGQSQKLFQVDEHVGIVAAGYVPDARVMVDNVRVFAQNNRLIYDEPLEVEGVARKLGDMAQQYTQYAGVRPFGVSLIVAGVDGKTPAIYVTDPSGTYLGFDAVAIGGGSEQATELLEQKYKEDMKLEEAISLAVESVKKAGEDKGEPKHVKVAVIDTESRKLRHLSEEEVGKYIKGPSQPEKQS
ncbi:MAG: archaeal proteasome endopeptidase complex subunit alpha [Nitrososphaerota archaeon]|nr:archaeal proteasome endopeptidase complex subunit alpha [Nitrososphaerota archaeon]MDG6939556.1 archaeal proteasome endopeptidase complex subunit alpha [Nitrososphaerota archaeon]